MSPLSFAMPLLAPKPGPGAVTQGLDFLRSLVTPADTNATGTSAAPPVALSGNPRVAALQQQMAQAIHRAGYGDALPLEVVDDGLGGLRVLSDHPARQQIEALLTADPQIIEQFRELAKTAHGDTRLQFAIPSAGLLDASA